MLTRRTVLKWTVGMSAAFLASPQSITRGSLLEMGSAEEPCPAVPNPVMERDSSMKPKNIVICSDGTGNWGGDSHPSNVYQLCDLLDLSDTCVQIAAYDSGVGTRVNETGIQRLNKAQPNLTIFPDVHRWIPFQDTLGLAAGFGLKENLKQLYGYLVDNYAEGDNLYLFGFSRGAFTVRALAGMLRRCGVLQDMERFSDVYDRSKVHYENIEDTKERCAIEAEHEDFKRRHGRDCRVKFLGVWDTVKSYGYLFPQSLAHTRHNEIVLTVRHALAIDEHRKFFEQTNWGGLDPDPEDPEHECKCPIRRQNVREVWFAGDHSDVGGGHEDSHNGLAQISLQWMLKESIHAAPSHPNDTLSLLLRNEDLLSQKITPNGSMVHFKRHNKLEEFSWKFVQDVIPRREVKNCPSPHIEWSFPWTHKDRRETHKWKRDNHILVHSSVLKLYDDRERQELLGNTAYKTVD